MTIWEYPPNFHKPWFSNPGFIMMLRMPCQGEGAGPEANHAGKDAAHAGGVSGTDSSLALEECMHLI